MTPGFAVHADLPHDLANDHDTALAHAHAERRTRIVVGVTLAMMALELVVGRLSQSLALVADGWHMATHAGALGLSAFAYWLARTRARHGAFTFGTGKVYALAGYTSALLLAVVAGWMLIESARRFAAPRTIDFGDALPVAALGLLVNLACAALLQHGHEDGQHDHNLRAAYLHVLADALTSVLAIVALLGGKYLGWTRLDPLMGVVGGAVILRWSWDLSRGAARQLLDAVPSADLDRALRARLETIDDVVVADLHTWDLGPARRGCVVSLFTSTPRATAYYRERILETAPFAHLTVEVHRCDHAPAPGA